MKKALLFVQLIGTVLILIFIPTNLLKTLVLLVFWLITFFPLNKQDVILYCAVCIFFTIMNFVTLKQGCFVFNEPDLLMMPYYELFMWGFYLLHTYKMIGGTISNKPSKTLIILFILYCAAFSFFTNPLILFIITGMLLIINLSLYHEPLDFAYSGYLILLGAIIEYTGVYNGLWHYPGNPLTGVPMWFLTLWGGVGFFFRRLVLPLIYSKNNHSTTHNNS